MTAGSKPLKFIFILLPILFLAMLIMIGLVLGPKYFGISKFPLEIVFISAATFTIAELLLLGYKWADIQEAIINKLAKGFPAILILFAIGLVIGSWIICGTIPMLVHLGINLIHPDYIYFLAFFIPIIFSTLTGTSWGSIGTVGAVLIGVATVVQADLGITAGAIAGGAFFGDKMSPLSDTTNFASMATEVNLYDHIGSMMYTTLPSAILSGIVFLIMGFVYPAKGQSVVSPEITETMFMIKELFNFNLLLILPPVIVLYGSLKRMSTLPVLLASTIAACLLALIFQPYNFNDLIATLTKGFDVSMAGWIPSIPPNVATLFNRGGLYALNEPIVFTIMVFVFIGALDMIDAMPRIVRSTFGFVKSKSGLIVSSLLSSAFTNAITSNQAATSFIVGDAFKKRYDEFGISRKVLSRSIEDYGTMIETVIPWTASSLFVVATLGVPFSDYWHWQLLALINVVMALILAVTGIGCFYGEKNESKE